MIKTNNYGTCTKPINCFLFLFPLIKKIIALGTSKNIPYNLPATVFKYNTNKENTPWVENCQITLCAGLISRIYMYFHLNVKRVIEYS